MGQGAAKILPVILAGGCGARLWPVSCEAWPKQFRPMAGGLSTYQMALQRVCDAGLFAPPLVMTGEGNGALARQQAEAVGVDPEIVAEPARRGSAAAVAVAAVVAERRAPHSLVLALAADQLIDDVAWFHDAVRLGSQAAAGGSIVAFGVTPDRPLTGFGYIKPGAAICGAADMWRVDSFVEKPDGKRAAEFVAAGYLWNSGNFLFRSDAMIGQLAEHAPLVLAAAKEAVAAARMKDGMLVLDAERFSAAPQTSIDYAVIEKAQNIAVVKGRFKWSDMGSWASIAELAGGDAHGNAVVGQGMVRDSRDCLIHSEGVMTVALGVEGLAIVVTPDAVLVMPKNRAEEVKAMVEELRVLRRNYTDP
jgi:mannose-1-phosphate guanylyltransferase/mannose-6-phosphate isomerase